jgi:hypothetical protein
MPSFSHDAQSIWMLYEQQAAPTTPVPVPAQASAPIANQPAAAQQPNQPPFVPRTYGDLKAIINRIKTKQKISNITGATGDTAANIAIDFAINAASAVVPGLAAAKTAFDFFKKATARPDTQKTKTFIDLLDVDDSMSKIVDDTVETEFLKTVETIINAYPNNQALPANWNMTNELIKFLRTKYKQSPAVLQHLMDIGNQAQAVAR